MEGGSSPASQEGLGQLRGAAQLTTSQLSSAPLQSLFITATTTALIAQVDSDSVNTSDSRTDSTVTVTVACGHDAAQENRGMYKYMSTYYVP